MQGVYRFLIFSVIFTLSFLTTVFSADYSSFTSTQFVSHLDDQPLAFTKNMGQWPDSILFRANANGAVMWFTKDGVYQQFFKRVSKESDSRDNDIEHLPEHDSIETMMIKTAFVEPNADVTIETGEVLAYTCNYFFGNDQNKWLTDVPNYSSITYKDIYVGIDLHYYSNGKQMEYDFIIAPHAELSLIRMKYEGADSIYLVDNQELVVAFPWGEIHERELFVHQGVPISVTGINTRYVLFDKHIFGFQLLEEVTNPLLSVVVDPVLTFGSYLGGSLWDEGSAIDVDNAGNLYVTGRTQSANFPMVGAIDGSFGGMWDVFVSKLSADGSALLFSTYLGGVQTDAPRGLLIDSSSAVCLSGYTASSDFPVQNAYDNTHNGGYDIFVTKLSSSGNTLLYGTFLGGSTDEGPRDIATDSSGCLYVGGSTSSADFPAVNGYDTTYNGESDVFFTKFSADGSSVVYSTFLGGTESDDAGGFAVDKFGNAYIGGQIDSDDFPIVNALDSLKSGSGDSFIAKIAPSGDSLVYSTFIGGNAAVLFKDVTVDTSGNAYIAGETSSSSLAVHNAFDSTYNGGSPDCFVAKISSAGDTRIFTTYLGGISIDQISMITLDQFDNVYVIGSTTSTNFPCQNALDTTLGTNPSHDSLFGVFDVFITKLASSGNSLDFSTYLGSFSHEMGYAIVVDQSENIYVSGHTLSTDFNMKDGYDNSSNGGPQDAFIMKFGSECCAGIRGNANNFGGTAVSDLTFLVQYLFNAGSAPSCFEEANINGTGNITIADLTYLVQYLFNSGPPPPACP